jgi:hypothetical protein
MATDVAQAPKLGLIVIAANDSQQMNWCCIQDPRLTTGYRSHARGRCGKLIVATDVAQAPKLGQIEAVARRNGRNPLSADHLLFAHVWGCEGMTGAARGKRRRRRGMMMLMMMMMTG